MKLTRKASVFILAGLLLAGTGLWLRQARQPRDANRAAEPAAIKSESAGHTHVAPSDHKQPQSESSAKQTQAFASRPGGVSDLDLVLGKGPRKDFHARLEAVGRLGRRLPTPDLQRLYTYLLDSTEDTSILPGQTFALKNDVMNVLREQEQTPRELTEVLLAIRNNQAQPLVMRDYALQHMAPWYSKVEAAQRERILSDVEAAAGETVQSYAGTALLAMNRIRAENPGVVVAALNEKVVALAQDSSVNLLARISAVQLSGELGLAAARPAVREVANDPSQPKTLRIAAIGALGRLGGSQDKTGILAQMAAASDPRLKTAAVFALAKLDRPAHGENTRTPTTQDQ